jgi:hypothetical protein
MRLVYTFDFEFTHNGWPQNIEFGTAIFFLFGRDRCLRLLKAINTKMRSLKRGSAILRFTNPQIYSLLSGRGMEMRHGARHRGAIFVNEWNLSSSIPLIHPLAGS